MKHYISIDLGGSKILGVLMDESGHILNRIIVKTNAHKGQRVVLEQIYHVIESLKEEVIKAINIILPCVLLDNKICECANVPLNHFDLHQTLEDRYQVPILMGNDVNIALLGEVKAITPTVHNAVGIFVGTGVGGGVYLNDELCLGLGAAGEIGHMNVVRDGLPCGCGARGCLESYASKRGMLNQMMQEKAHGRKSKLFSFIQSSDEIMHTDDLLECLVSGDELTLELIDRSIEYLAITISNINNMLHPEVFIMGGGVIEALGHYMIPRIEQKAKQLTMPSLKETLTIKPTILGDDAGVIGGYYQMKEVCK